MRYSDIMKETFIMPYLFDIWDIKKGSLKVVYGIAALKNL